MQRGKPRGPGRPTARTLAVEVLEDRLLLASPTLLSSPARLSTTARTAYQPVPAITIAGQQADVGAYGSPLVGTKMMTTLAAPVPSEGAGGNPALRPDNDTGSYANAIGRVPDDDAAADRYEQGQRQAQLLVVVSANVNSGQTLGADGGRVTPVPLTPTPPSVAITYTPATVEILPGAAEAARAALFAAAVPAPVVPPPSDRTGPLGCAVEVVVVSEPIPLFALADRYPLRALPVQLTLPVQSLLPLDTQVVQQATDAFFAKLDRLGVPADEGRASAMLAPLTIAASALLFEYLRRRERKPTHRLAPGESVGLGLSDVPLGGDA